MTDADLLAWLNGTKNPDHNFSTYLGASPDEDDDRLHSKAWWIQAIHQRR